RHGGGEQGRRHPEEQFLPTIGHSSLLPLHLCAARAARMSIDAAVRHITVTLQVAPKTFCATLIASRPQAFWTRHSKSEADTVAPEQTLNWTVNGGVPMSPLGSASTTMMAESRSFTDWLKALAETLPAAPAPVPGMFTLVLSYDR